MPSCPIDEGVSSHARTKSADPPGALVNRCEEETLALSAENLRSLSKTHLSGHHTIYALVRIATTFVTAR